MSTTPAGAVRERLTAAKLWLVSEPPAGAIASAGDGSAPRALPYLAHALFALVPVPSREVTALAVDEHWRLYVNPDWIVAAEIPEIGRELAHETWHLLQDHARRARGMHVDGSTAEHWTRASDATVAATLAVDQLRPAALRDAADLALPLGRTAEEYFAMLSRLPAQAPDGSPAGDRVTPGAGCGSGCDGIPREHELPPDADVGAVDAEDALQIRRRVAIDYRQHVTSRGTEPGDAWRWATGLLEPRVPWEAVLSGAVRRAVGWVNGRADYTYSRPSRRQSSSPHVVWPGTRRPLPSVAMVVDTSGSVDDGLLRRAMSEVEGALRALGVHGQGVTVLSCDAAVHTVSRVRRARDTRLGGGGGTDMRVGLRTAVELRPRPDLVVVLTDGWTTWPETGPAATAVVAAILGRDRSELPPSPDWATRAECLLD